MLSKKAYARVSDIRQNEDRQLVELIAFGVPEKNIYTDKQSGKDFKRSAYQKMYRTLKKDDLLVIKSIDRLGRNYHEIKEGHTVRQTSSCPARKLRRILQYVEGQKNNR